MSKLLLEGGTVVTLDAERRIIEDGAILIAGDRIDRVGPRGDLAELRQPLRVLDVRNKLIFPGLINTHTHLFQTLLRGIGHDQPVWHWFETCLDPTVGHLTLEDSYISAKLGAIEAIRSGTTTILDYNYPHPVPRMADEVIRAFRDVGIRGILARGILDAGDVHRTIVHETEAELSDCERLIKKHDGADDGMIHVWLAPYTVFSASRQAFKAAKELAEEYETWLTIHAATPSSIESAKELYGLSDLEFEDSIGFLGPNVLAVHCCGDIGEKELEILRRNDVKISHNPISNAYLGEGVAPVVQMLAKGLSVGLATDGAASNNNQDMITTMKFAALLQKISTLDPACITAQKVVEMATVGGATCVGLGNMIGSIEPGKRADLIVVDPWRPNTIALHDPVSSLVYSCTQENIDTVIINGKIILENREMRTIDEEEVMALAQIRAEELLDRADLLARGDHASARDNPTSRYQ